MDNEHTQDVRRALVVEDDEDVRDVLTMLLTIIGFDVTQASNGRVALDKLEAGYVPDVIVLDLMMPVMNGWTFRAEQKRIPAVRDVPVIILSARHPPYRDGEQIEAAEILPKPFELDTFLAAVARHFPDSASRQPAWLGTAGVVSR